MRDQKLAPIHGRDWPELLIMCMGRAGISGPRVIDGGAFLTRSRGRDYFTEPAVRPATKLFWRIRKAMTTGTDTASEAAMIWFQ